MAVNEQHPDYPEYLKKWDALVRKMKEEEKACRPSGTLDGGTLSDIWRKYNLKFKELKKEYKHLFE